MMPSEMERWSAGICQGERERDERSWRNFEQTRRVSRQREMETSAMAVPWWELLRTGIKDE